MTSYLDHAASSPLSAGAQQAWLTAVEELRSQPGNPAAQHSGGRAARRMLEDARERVAHAIGAEKNEVLFTSGATESDALGVMGTARGSRAKDPARTRIVVSGLEHDAVGKQEAVALRASFTWEELSVNATGVSDFRVPDPQTVAVASMSLVCAETGTVQPVAELVSTIGGAAPVHTDAAQAVGRIPVDYGQLGVDLLTLSGHKVGGPVGIGALVVRRGVEILTDREGGGQERKFRSGTQDVAGAAAFAAALEESVSALSETTHAHQALRGRLLGGLPAGVHATSDAAAAPGIVHLSLPTASPEVLLLMMDQEGVLVSAGSACHAGVTRPSEILLRMGRTQEQALGVLRVSFGPETGKDDIDRFLGALPGALKAAQLMDGRNR